MIYSIRVRNQSLFNEIDSITIRYINVERAMRASSYPRGGMPPPGQFGYMQQPVYQGHQPQHQPQRVTSAVGGYLRTDGGETAAVGGMTGMGGNGMGVQMGAENPNVLNVWKWNLEEQMSVLRQAVDQYRYVAIDCKFPGIVARPIGVFKSTSEYHYQTLRANVDILQVIQIGITLFDENGNYPINTPGTWQFNFKFNANEDMCSSEGIELLRQSGIDFARHETEGINIFAFGELMISSGLVLDDTIHWLTFHSGYDLGYLLSIMLNRELQVEEPAFLDSLKTYFPHAWDVKYLVKAFKLSTKNQLADVAEEFGIRRQGLSSSGVNQAGVDSQITASLFLETRRIVGEQNIAKLVNSLFGLGDSFTDEELAANVWQGK